MPFVIVYGDLNEGIQGVIGPFDTKKQAEEYADSHGLDYSEGFFYELEPPEVDRRGV